MTRKDFIKFIEEREFARRALLESKGHAYSGDVDAFLNFKRNAEKVGITKYQIWLVYFQKHLDAIVQAIKDNPSNPVDYSEGLEGRIDDAINYLNLFAGMNKEDKETPAPQSDIYAKHDTRANS